MDEDNSAIESDELVDTDDSADDEPEVRKLKAEYDCHRSCQSCQSYQTSSHFKKTT